MIIRIIEEYSKYIELEDFISSIYEDDNTNFIKASIQSKLLDNRIIYCVVHELEVSDDMAILIKLQLNDVEVI